MRQIKFRAWVVNFSEPKGVMHYPEKTEPNSAIANALFYKLGYKHFITAEQIYEDWQKKMEFMQYTGLTDRNGKEIYEGDIVRFHYFYQSYGSNMGAVESEHSLTGVVQWLEVSYGIAAIKGDHFAGYTGYSDGEGEATILDLAVMNEGTTHEESFEVIGNIYENPELLSLSLSTEADTNK